MDGPVTGSEPNVLLRCSLPMGKRIAVYAMLPVVAAVLAAVAAGLIRLLGWKWSLLIPDEIVIAVLVMPLLAIFMLTRIAGRLACTNEGMTIWTIMGKRETVTWNQVSIYRRTWYGAFLDAGARRPVYLLFSGSELKGLLCLVREASNARVTGFS